MATVSRSASVCVVPPGKRGPERARPDRNTNSAPSRALRIAIALLFVFSAALIADDTDDALKLKAFRELNPDNRAAKQKRVEFHPGYVELHYFGMDWRFFYIPLLAPLPGARLEDAGKIPNAFEQLGMPYASTMPPMFGSERSAAVEREYQRIEKLTRQQKVEVHPDPSQ